MRDYDTTEHVEETQTGYRLAVTSNRGTDVRDQDEVKLVGKTQTLEELENQRERIHEVVVSEMRDLRYEQPDDDVLTPDEQAALADDITDALAALDDGEVDITRAELDAIITRLST